MKTCFSEGKLMKQFGNPLFLRGPPPPPISEQFFHEPPLCGYFQNKKLPLIFGGEETMRGYVFKIRMKPC